MCTDCHESVEKGPIAGIPSVKTCMICHSQIATDRPLIKQVTSYSDKGIDIPWQRVYGFTHEAHVRGKVACAECHGLGSRSEFDPMLIAPNRALSIATGALRPYVPKTGKETMHEYMRGLFAAVARKNGFTIETPLKDLSELQLDALMHGVRGKVTVEFPDGRVFDGTPKYPQPHGEPGPPHPPNLPDVEDK